MFDDDISFLALHHMYSAPFCFNILPKVQLVSVRFFYYSLELVLHIVLNKFENYRI